VETSEKMEAPLAPTPFLIFCAKKKKQSISWCRNKFPSLSDREKLKWIDLALAEEANYLVIFYFFNVFIYINFPSIFFSTNLRNSRQKILTLNQKLCLF